MYNYIRRNFCKGLLSVAGVALMMSCSDTWNDHYEAASMNGYDGTLMQALEEQAPDFAKVVKAVKFDRELASDNVYTVWAPESFNVDSVLAVAKTDSAAVVDKFLKNHISRYAVSYDGAEHVISLVNKKKTSMTGSMFSTSKLIAGKTNLSCDNGVLHVIDKVAYYQPNLYEFIEDSYKASSDANKEQMGGSIYTYLAQWNADSLDENRSVSRGVDENGDKIWVDSFTIRNNTVLKNFDAQIYDEDSSFIAIIPTEKAWQERYEFAKKLLVFNPSEDKASEGACDSLTNHYANTFAMTDLFYNKNANEHWQDSLKSTNYGFGGHWWDNVYYSKTPKFLVDGKEVNDILSKCGTPVACSNGDGYLVDEYPMTPYEQFFKPIDLRSSMLDYYTDKTQDASGKDKYTKQVGSQQLNNYSYSLISKELENMEYDEDGYVVSADTVTKVTYHTVNYVRYEPSSKNSQPSIGIQVPNTLSGTYDVYLLTARNYVEQMRDTKSDLIALQYMPNQFKVTVYERLDQGTSSTPVGSYGSGVELKNPADGSKNFVTGKPEDGVDLENLVDTTYIGEYTFKNAYYGRKEAGVIFQFNVNVNTKLSATHSKEMLLNALILQPRKEGEAPEASVKAPVQAQARKIISRQIINKSK